MKKIDTLLMPLIIHNCFGLLIVVFNKAVFNTTTRLLPFVIGGLVGCFLIWIVSIACPDKLREV